MIEIKVNKRELDIVLAKLQNAGDMRLRIMGGLGMVLQQAVARGFREEADPVTGDAWAELSPVTQARRAKDGHTGKKLQVSGALAAGFHDLIDLSENSVTVGTNKVYAPTLHYGAKQGAFGKTKRGGPIPWGDIPARPFLPIGEGGQMNTMDEDEIRDVLQKRLQ